MAKKQKSFRKKYKKNGGDNTSSSSRRKRREEIREKTAAAAENRRKKREEEIRETRAAKVIQSKFKSNKDRKVAKEKAKRREQIREKNATIAQNRRKRQTYRQPSYQPRQRRNLRRYVDSLVDHDVSHIKPFQDYVTRECFGHECDLLYPHTRQPIYDRAMTNRNRDLLMSELNSRILPAEDRIAEREYNTFINRSRNNLPYLDEDLRKKITGFMY